MVEIGFSDRVFPATKIVHIATALRERGIPINKALEGAGLSEKDIFSSRTRVSQRQTLQVVTNASKLISDPSFAFEIGLQHHLTTYGMYGFAIMSAPTARQAFKYSIQYYEISNPLIEMSVYENSECFYWTFSPRIDLAIDKPVLSFLMILYLGITVSIHRDIMGENCHPHHIDVEFPETIDFLKPIYTDIHEITYQQPQTRMCYNKKWYDHPTKFGNSLIFDDLIEKSDELLASLASEAGLIGRVRKILLFNAREKIDQNVVCRKLGVSPRTLRRELRLKDTSFRQVRDEIRQQLAIQYLQGTNLSIEEVGVAVGFSDAANFRRALRRATGMSPQQLRSLGPPLRTARL